MHYQSTRGSNVEDGIGVAMAEGSRSWGLKVIKGPGLELLLCSLTMVGALDEKGVSCECG